MAYRDMLIPQVTVADTSQEVEELVDYLLADFAEHGKPVEGESEIRKGNSWQVDPVTVMTPREAFYSPVCMVGREEALGRVSAELVAPYPPGIPVLAPGELITESVLALLMEAKEAGVHIAYATDPSLRMFAVIEEDEEADE